MANNPYVNKVIYGENTLIDLTNDTVTPEMLKRGTTAHMASGEMITGQMEGLPAGGTQGQVLTKKSTTDYDTDWQSDQSTTPTTLGPTPIATFDASAADMPLKGLVVNIEPVQDLHGYDNPWPARAGKNLINTETSITRKYLNENGEEVSQINFAYTALISVNPGNSYTYSYSQRNTQKLTTRVHGYDSNGNWIRQLGFLQKSDVNRYSLTIEIPNDIQFVRVSYSKAYFADIQLELGSSATAYEPYSNICPITGWTGCTIVNSPTTDAQDGTTYDITFPTEAGTVYGGTLDVTSGVLTVTDVQVDLGDLAWNKTTGYTYPVFYSSVDNMLLGNQANFTLLCSEYIPYGVIGITNFGNNLHDKEVAIRNANTHLMIQDSSYNNATAAEMKDGVHGIKLVYRLATPQTYQLTASQITTLLGTNNVWADCGDVTVTYGEYLETIKAHAERLGDSILSAIAPLETSYTATRDYAVGAFLFVGTKFYKVIAAIQTGETITVDTNVEQTTVAEQLLTKPAILG